jgi:hypothetical protein
VLPNSHFLHPLLLHIGTEFFGIALTIGIIDEILRRNRRKTHQIAIKGSISRLYNVLIDTITAIDKIKTIDRIKFNEILILNSYITLEMASRIAERLILLVDINDPEFASVLDSIVYTIDELQIEIDISHISTSEDSSDEKLESIKTKCQSLYDIIIKNEVLQKQYNRIENIKQ